MNPEKLNINLTIGENNYPMKIDPSEEQNFREAQKIAQTKYLKYKSKYTNLSIEDILAMTIIDLAKNNIDLQQKKESSVIFTELSDIVGTLGDYLKAQ